MSTHKNIDQICVAFMCLSILLAVLFMNGRKLGIIVSADPDSEAHSDDVYFTDNDLDSGWDTSDAVYINLDDVGTGNLSSQVYSLNGSVVIGAPGKYVVSGTLNEGSLIVDAYDNSKVWILFDNVNISRSDDSCLIVNQADKVFLTLSPSSVNSLNSGSVFSDEAAADGRDGAVFSRDDLTINGSGSLSVKSGYKHAIAANDDLVITGGSLTLSAENDCIHANDSIRVRDASISISSGDDGIAADNEDGWIYIESGDFSIDCADEGIYAPGSLTLSGGQFCISTGTDQGHHGIRSDEKVLITGGDIIINSCYEGITAPDIEIADGNIEIYPADDGLNASNGSSSGMGMGGMNGGGGMGAMPGEGGGDGMGGMPGRGGEETISGANGKEGGTFHPSMNGNGGAAPGSGPLSGNGTVSGDLPSILISGGTLTIVNESARDADGLDSNGDITITGGDIRVSLTGTGSNSAIDYGSESGGTAAISGGTIIACGSYAMAEGFDSTSSQCSILYNISDGVEKGTSISLEDNSGNALLSWDVPCSFSSAVLSCPSMKIGDSYLVVIGDSAEEVTLNETASSFGNAESSMFGGNFTMGGMQNIGNFGGPGGGGRGRHMSGMSDNSMSPPPDGGGPGQPGTDDAGSGEGEDVTVSVSDNSSSELSSSSYLDSSNLFLLAESILILLAGLFIAYRYRRQ